MTDPRRQAALEVAHERSLRWLDSLATRPVRPSVDADAVAAALVAGTDGSLPQHGAAPEDAVARLADAVEPGLMASPGGRFFGWVMGGTVPASMAADWLTSAWDQNAGLTATSPAAAATEHVTSRWLLELLGLPATASVGFVTGGNQANFSCLAAARHAVLARHGWDVERLGLQGAPTVRVIASAERHATVDTALRYLGLGSGTVHEVATDGQSRMLLDDLARVLAAGDGPTIVCTAAGNVNTGSFDDHEAVVALAHEHDAWVHVDGAFGLWAAVSPRTSALVRGVAGADSWATDGHKTLNVPYDSGFAIVADEHEHRGALAVTAAYIAKGTTTVGDPLELVPEFSRRARGFPTWAALASLGRDGVVDLVEGLCARATQLADELRAIDGVSIENDVVFNQVLFRVNDDDARTRAVCAAVCARGDAFMSPTTWKGRAGVRASVIGWQTTADDITRAAAAVATAMRTSGDD